MSSFGWVVGFGMSMVILIVTGRRTNLGKTINSLWIPMEGRGASGLLLMAKVTRKYNSHPLAENVCNWSVGFDCLLTGTLISFIGHSLQIAAAVVVYLIKRIWAVSNINGNRN